MVSKYIWLSLKDINESLLKSFEIYIPYNCQFLQIKQNLREKEFFIQEIYYSTFNPSAIVFKRHFGTWKENKEVEIIEPDLYKRRLDLNETILNTLHNVSQY